MRRKRLLNGLLSGLLVSCMVLSLAAAPAAHSDAGTAKAVSADSAAAANSEKAADSVAAAAEILRNAMKNREEKIIISYTGTGLREEELIAQMKEKAFAHTGQPTEGDYLKFQTGDLSCSTEAFEGGLRLTFGASYFTTLEQEQALDAKLEKDMAGMISGGSSYERLKAIYDYICDNVEYNTNTGDGISYLTRCSAYGALMKGGSNCRGYALLFYRMALKAGVDVRMITGSVTMDGNSTPHEWNIAKIGSLYYNVDANWEDNIGGSTKWYFYFLKGTNGIFEHGGNAGGQSIPAHVRDEAYKSASFQAAYPMSKEDYNGDTPEETKHTHSYGTPVFKWNEDNSRCTAVFTCSGCDSTENADCRVSSRTNEPTGTADGKTVYTATVEFNGKTYTETKEVVLASTGTTAMTESATESAAKPTTEHPEIPEGTESSDDSGNSGDLENSGWNQWFGSIFGGFFPNNKPGGGNETTTAEAQKPTASTEAPGVTETPEETETSVSQTEKPEETETSWFDRIFGGWFHRN
ncbi:MAG: transglutaminase domain-containing protein [Lachnospiraceae bacterium]|nr:transglutaminase domain-containing protein [Lachnospiraceae bacterium]